MTYTSAPTPTGVPRMYFDPRALTPAHTERVLGAVFREFKAVQASAGYTNDVSPKDYVTNPAFSEVREWSALLEWLGDATDGDGRLVLGVGSVDGPSPPDED